MAGILRILLVQGAYALAGFILSQASIFGSYSPFGISFVAAVNPTGLPAAISGSALGYVLSHPEMMSMRYIAALLITGMGVYIFRRFSGNPLSDTACACIALLSTLSTGIVVMLTGSISFANSALYLAEAITAGGAAFFMKVSIEAIAAKKSLKYIKPSLLVCLMIFFGIILLSLDFIKIMDISLARILAAFIVMLAARYSKESGGALAGITSGLTLSLSAGSGHLMSGYAAGGLLAGFFGQYGRFVAAISFMTANAVCAMSSEDTLLAVQSIIESAIAALIMVLLPKKICFIAEEFFSSSASTLSGESYKNLLRFKLSTAAASVSTVSSSIDAASNTIRKIAPASINSVFDAVRNDVCSRCVRRSSCWDYNFESTNKSFNDIAALLKTEKTISPELIPPYFAANCKHVEPLLESFNGHFNKFTIKNSLEGKDKDIRNVAVDQISALSAMLSDMCEELTRDILFIPDTSDTARTTLESIGVNVTDVFCLCDENNHTLIQVLCGPKRKRVTNKAVLNAMYDATGIEFEPPLVIEAEKGSSMLYLCEKTALSVSTGTSQYIGEGQEYSGDAFSYFLDGKGNYNLVLSDGMGSGARAAVDGTMAAGLCAQLIKADFSPECIIKTVNCALMVKSREETLATLDLLSVNLYSGEAVFMKAGAAATFIYRDNRTMRAECSSLPLGIIQEVEFQRIGGRLLEKDIVITISDGASTLTKNIINDLICENTGCSAAILAGKLAKKARDLNLSEKIDDITVIVSVFGKNDREIEEKHIL